MGLINAMGLSGREMVCFTGAGGKSELMIKLASEYTGNGGRVLVTTSAKMLEWQLKKAGKLILDPDGKALFDKIKAALSESGTLAAGSGCTGDKKIAGLSIESLETLFRPGIFDSILVEADGSRGKSLKAPAGHEPVLPPSCTTMAPVIGIDILGRPLTEEFVHRHSIAAQITGQEIGSAVTEETILKIIMHYSVLAEKVSGRIKIIPAINKVDCRDMIKTARNLAGLILNGRIKRVLVTSAIKADPVWEVVS